MASLSQNPQGQVTLELNPLEVEAYVKKEIDRRLDTLFLSHARQPLSDIVRLAVHGALQEMIVTGQVRAQLREAVGDWLDKRQGWISSVIVRGHVKKAPSPNGRGWTDPTPEFTGKSSWKD